MRSWVNLLPSRQALAFFLLLASRAATAAGDIGEYQRIASAELGYDLQYRVYRPAGTSTDDSLPTLYVTDGEAYLQHGNFESVLDEVIGAGRARPVVVVFLDSRNPDNLRENRRNEEFMCNTRFAAFFANELIPRITREQPVSRSRDDRVILGVSFGGLNSACFGLMLPNLFGGIAMHSPASGAHLDVVRELYEESEPLPVKVFMSAGTRNDNLDAVRRFRWVLESKGYDLTFIKVRKGHDWENWGPLLDDVLVTFFSGT
ncbi:MAG: alpha/beta hydrolase-fold protein [Woeseiaceae bacterium]|jgi:enterochelin esterase-like enzyme